MQVLTASTLNVGKDGASKCDRIEALISDHPLVALQELDLPSNARIRFQNYWTQRRWHSLLGPSGSPGCRVGLLSKHPLLPVRLSTEFPDRVVCGALELPAIGGGYQKVLFASVYGFAGDSALSRRLHVQVADALLAYELPFLLLGDFNLTEEELAELFCTRRVLCLDHPFQITPLPATCTGTRRIDYGVCSLGLQAQHVWHTDGVADHLMVSYAFDIIDFLPQLSGPLRASQTVPAHEVEERWRETWNALDFSDALQANNHDEAWSLLSRAAEASLFFPVCHAVPRDEAWSPTPKVAPVEPKVRTPLVLRRLRKLCGRLREAARHPQDYLVRANAVSASVALKARFPELAGLHVDACADFLPLVTRLLDEAETAWREDCLSQWRLRVASSLSDARGWVKERAAARCRPDTCPAKSPAQVRRVAIHPQRVLDDAEASWGKEWTKKEVQLDQFVSLFDLLPHLDAPNFDSCLSADDLIRSAKSMKGRAAGPDGWTSDSLLCLPVQFWTELGRLWTQILQAGGIPQRWLEAKVTLIPKRDSNEMRPLAIASVLWRLGSRAVLQRLRTWMDQWLEETTCGGVHEAGVADVRQMLFQDGAEPHVFIQQDLTRFFDSVDWDLMTALLQRLNAPPLFTRLMSEFYGRGRRLFGHAGRLSKQWVSTSRGIMQGDPCSPMIGAAFMLLWGKIIKRAGARIVSFVDDRSFWAPATAAGHDVLRAAKRASDHFDQIAGFRCRPTKCSVASPTAHPCGDLASEFGYDVSSTLSLLGAQMCLDDPSQLKLARSSLSLALERASCIRWLPVADRDKKVLLKQLVLPLFTWCPSAAVNHPEDLQHARVAVADAYIGRPLVDAPMVLKLAVLGYDLDPRAEVMFAVLRAGVKLAQSSPRWQEHVPISVGAQRWYRTVPGVMAVLDELKWTTSPSGDALYRYDDYGCRRCFRIGFDPPDVLRMWVHDHHRRQALAATSRVHQHLNREDDSVLDGNGRSVPIAKGLDLVKPPGRLMVFGCGHKACFETPAGKFVKQAALATGASVWSKNPGVRLSALDRKAKCACGSVFPSRPHLAWNCDASPCRGAALRWPSNRIEERLFAYACLEKPGAPFVLDPEDAVQSCAEQLLLPESVDHVYMFTDGSVVDDCAAYACVIPICNGRVALGVQGESQTAFHAETAGLLCALRAIAHAGPRLRCKAVYIVSDCQAALRIADGGPSALSGLAAALRDALLQARRYVQVGLIWVPSHGKKPGWTPPAGHDELVLRAGNASADREASNAANRRAHGSQRQRWLQAMRIGRQWEIDAVLHLARVAEAYEDFLGS